jgi:hypothetical protein
VDIDQHVLPEEPLLMSENETNTSHNVSEMVHVINVFEDVSYSRGIAEVGEAHVRSRVDFTTTRIRADIADSSTPEVVNNLYRLETVRTQPSEKVPTNETRTASDQNPRGWIAWTEMGTPFLSYLLP